MKKTLLLFAVVAIFQSCNKDSFAPEITLGHPSQGVTEYYPGQIKCRYVSGDTIFKDTLYLFYPDPSIQMTESSTVFYNFSFPIWSNSGFCFYGKLIGNQSIILHNQDQTKSVAYKLLI